MKLSIVIPVYNVEKYLAKCIESCLKQDVDVHEYEIIIVNDGSPDGSSKIIEFYYSQNHNIKVLNQENQGLSMARNNGLEVAHGEYVWFIDSDDWIDENCLSGIFNCFDTAPDLIQLGYKEIYEDSNSIGKIVCTSLGVGNGKEVLVAGGLPPAAQFTIYRRAFLNNFNLRFKAGILHEDIEFKPRVTYFAKNVVYYPYAVYSYLQRSAGSIMSSYKLRNVHDQILVYVSLIDFMNHNVREKDVYRAFMALISMNFNSILKGLSFLNHEDVPLAIKMIENNKWIFSSMLRSGKIKYVIEGLIFKIHVKVGIKLHKFIKN